MPREPIAPPAPSARPALPAPTAAPAPLNYAAPARRSSRRYLWRLFLLSWAAFTVYLAYDHWEPWLRLQVPMLQEQRRCLRFTEPADRVVFETAATRVAALLQKPGYTYSPAGAQLQSVFATTSPSAQPSFSPGAAISTNAEKQFQSLQGAWDVLMRLEELRNPQPSGAGGSSWGGSLFGGGGPDAQTIVFLHRRRAGAAERLVVIRADWFASSISLDRIYSEWIGFSCELISPASPTGIPDAVSCKVIEPAVTLRPSEPMSFLRVYAGQPDPADEARFTIDYETRDGRGTIEGRLRPDDTVEMRAISGPATRAALAQPARAGPADEGTAPEATP